MTFRKVVPSWEPAVCPSSERRQGSRTKGGLVAREADGPVGAISVRLTIKQTPGKQTTSVNPFPKSTEG